jgi:hypothetical protein
VAEMRVSHRRKIIYYLRLLLSGHRLYSRGSIDADFGNNHATVIVLVVTLGRSLKHGCRYHIHVTLSSIPGLPTQMRRLFFVLRRNAARLRTSFIHYLDTKYMPMVEMVSNEISRKRRSQSAVERLFSRLSRQAFSLGNRIHQQLNN